MSTAELTDLLRKLTRAEDAGDQEAARSLRAEILRIRTSAPPDGPPPAHLEPLDHALIERIAIDLARQDRHSDALALLAPASDDARQRGDRRRGAAVDLLAAQSAVALLDLEAAREILARWIRVGSGGEAALSSAAALGRLRAGAEWEDDLAGRAYATLAQFWAAQGHLPWALAALQRLERLFDSGPVRGISREGLRVRIAELHLSRGDFPAFERLAQAEAQGDPGWDVLRAERLLLSGHLSDAEHLLGNVGRGAPEHLVEEAAWLRANILGTLNRLTEADELVSQALSKGSRASDWRRLNDLLDARRSFAAGVGVMPLPGGRRHPAGRPSARPDAYQAPESFERRYAEVGAEWTWRANEVLLALHAGDLANADLLRRALGHLAANIESPLIAAKQLVIESLVDHYQGHFASALDKAGDAHQRLMALDCPIDAVTACQVRGWAIARLGLDSSERGRAAREDSERVLAIFRQRLSPADQVFALLNRWSRADQALAAHIDRAPLGARGRWGAWRRRFRTRAVVRAVFDEKKWPEADRRQPAAAEGPRPSEEGNAASGVLEATKRQLAIRSARAGTRAAPLLALPAELLPSDAAVVLYVSLADRLEIFFGDRRGFRRLSAQVRATRAAFWEAVRVATGLLHGEGCRWADVASSPQVSELAALLGIDVLAREASPRVKRLFVIPDDAVVHVPFGALPLNGKPLACRFAPAFLPRPSWALRPAASATPALAVGLDIDTGAGAPLPGAGREMDLAVQINPGAHVLRGRVATRDAVLEALGAATSVHFATHGRFDAQHPHDTALAVAGGWVSVEDLQRCVSPALRLAFLGACWGANTFVLPGRELISLPVGLLDGGAHEVVASLWPVFDEPSVRFARAFYRAYRASGDASRSTAFVQKCWWRDRPASDWAPYVAYASGLVPSRTGRALLRAWSALRRCAAAVRGSS